MSRKTTAFAALATLAGAGTLFLGLDSARAETEAPAARAAERAPARLQPEPRLDAAVPVAPAPEFIAAPVVQPLPAAVTAPPPAPAFSPRPASLTALVAELGTAGALTPELHCLASAVYFEARGEPLEGQLAVAQVIVNRSRDARFARGYCGAVHQPGQFSFLRGGRIPAVREGTAAWARAQAIAKVAHEGLWSSAAGDAVFFHATYVRPAWSHRKTRLAQIDTHVFYR